MSTEDRSGGETLLHFVIVGQGSSPLSHRASFARDDQSCPALHRQANSLNTYCNAEFLLWRHCRETEQLLAGFPKDNT